MILLILKKTTFPHAKVPWTFIRKYVPSDSVDILIERSLNRPEKSSSVPKKARTYVDLEKLNDCKSICSYLKVVNESLELGGQFIGRFETHAQKINSQKINKIPVLRSLNKGYEFMIHRVVPKTRGIRHIYNWITQRKNRRLTKTEVLGRVVRAGFSIEAVDDNINNSLYFVAKKVSNTVGTRNPGFGLLYKMPRVGMNGNIIYVYKFRTMHPFAEYLQAYIYEKNGTKDGDKLIDDFRVSKWGKILRKYWIDELPMILNLFKRDIKLVGIRPLSRHKFETYPEYLQNLRIKTKPGLFPPYYADLPKNQLDFFKSEEKYLRSYLRLGRKIDRKYFYLCMNNIIVKMKRSS